MRLKSAELTSLFFEDLHSATPEFAAGMAWDELTAPCRGVMDFETKAQTLDKATGVPLFDVDVICLLYTSDAADEL